jgi:glycosyltransferase involved in cell wall biosynthesis
MNVASAIGNANAQLRLSQVDLVHAHDALFSAAALQLGKPLVLTVHGPLSREIRMMGKGSPAYLRYIEEQEHAAYQGARAIIAVDSGQRDIVVNDFGVSPEKIHVIYNAVDTLTFAPGPADEAPPFFLVPRRLVKKNGVQVAIAAMVSVPDVELWIAGDGPEGSMLRQQAEQLGLAPRVRFLGTIPSTQMTMLMRQALGVVIPSVPVEGVIEASSIAALEAMATGRPVIASRIGGLAELIEDGATGLLFEEGRPEALALALNRVLESPALAVELGARSRTFVCAHHNQSAWADSIIRIYQQVLNSAANDHLAPPNVTACQ